MHGLAVIHQRRHCLSMVIWRRDAFVAYLPFSLICFSSNLHVTGFSSCRITTMIHSYLVWFLWWLRHGAIGPIEATLFGVNADWTDFRIYTFELVIRLSKVQQLAFLFCTFFENSRGSGRPRDPSDLHLSQREIVRNNQKLLFCHCSLSFRSSTWQVRLQATGMSFSCRCGLFGIWWGETCCAPNSLELESRLCHLGQELTTFPDRE